MQVLFRFLTLTPAGLICLRRAKANFTINSISAMQLCNVKQHGRSEIHKLATKALYRPTVAAGAAAQQKVGILARAKECRDQRIRFECYGSTASISDCLEKVEASWRSPGELNKAHRVFVLSTALLFDNSPQPWVAGGTWTKSYMAEYKALLQLMKEEASADGDASLHFSGAFSGTSIEAGFVFGQRDRNSSSVRGAFRACRPGA